MSVIENVARSARERMARFVAAFKAERESQEPTGRYDTGAVDARPVTPAQNDDEFPLPPTWPYPGLRAFTPREARVFFGRHREAGDLRRRLADSNIVAVLGGSGSGKSSLVLAGVLPRLNDVGRIPGRHGRWYPVSFRPGDAPCRRLVDALWNDACLQLLALKGGPQAFAEVLGDDAANNEAGAADDYAALRARFEALVEPDGKFSVDGLTSFLNKLDEVDKRLAELRGTPRAGRINLLLLIDQFEELFRDTVRKERPDDISRITELLTSVCNHRGDPLVVVITLRSEELHRCAETDGLVRVINTSVYLVDRPNLDALDMATVRPGRQTLQYWSVPFDGDGVATEEGKDSAEGESAPFAPTFIGSLGSWVRDFQKESFVTSDSVETRKRHQSDLLPLFQHLLRVSWRAAVERWAEQRPERPTVEVSDIEDWIKARGPRVQELRVWMQANQKASVLYSPPHLDNMLERCFDTGFAIGLSEAITDRPWTELESWPADDPSMLERLRLIQAAFVALATRDDKGNDARCPASAAEIVAASHREVSEEAVRRTLSFFKQRNYLQGGDNGDRYDVSHEALIRNSTEYQTWLADAKNTADALSRANAALEAGHETVEHEVKNKPSNIFVWIGSSLKESWRSFLLGDLRDAGDRFSEATCRDLERIFENDAMFSPAWMAGRAQLGKTAGEQAQAVQNIERTWIKAYRWHINADAGRKEGERAYLGIDVVRAVQLILARDWYSRVNVVATWRSIVDAIRSKRPVSGRGLRALRSSIIFYLIFGLLPVVYSQYQIDRSARERIATVLGYAKNPSSDFRVRLLLLADTLRANNNFFGSTLRATGIKALEEATRETLLRSPVFAGTFGAAAWDASGERIVTLKSEDADAIVYDLSGKKEPSSSKLSRDELNIALVPAIGFFNAKGKVGESLAAFRSESGTVLAGNVGLALTKKFAIPRELAYEGEWIGRADIFADHVRAIFLQFASGAIDGMSVAELSGPLILAVDVEKLKEQKVNVEELIEQKVKELKKQKVNWNPFERRAVRQPVLAEDCNHYAYLGRVESAEAVRPGPGLSSFWHGQIGNGEPTQVYVESKFDRGQVAIARGCAHALVRGDTYLKDIGQLNVISLHDHKVVQTVNLDSLDSAIGLFLAPASTQVQPIFAAAPVGSHGWRVGWPTERGLAVVDITQGSKEPSLHLPAGGQMLTGLETRYELGSLSFSPDGSRALLLQQATFTSLTQVRVFDLNFEKRLAALAELKTVDDLVRKACQIAKLDDGGGRLTDAEARTALGGGAGTSVQPCPQDE